MPELNTDDPALWETVHRNVQYGVQQGDDFTAIADRVISGLVGLASPEPSEPPPGPYRDRSGEVWLRSPVAERYRVGRSLGRTVYRQVGEDASKEDVFLGIFDDKAMAARVVDLLNGAERERDAAVSALTKVRELHKRYDPAPSNPVAPYLCRTCDVPWPCPTAAALSPVDSPEDTNG